MRGLAVVYTIFGLVLCIGSLLTIIASGMLAISFMRPNPDALAYYANILHAAAVFAYSGILFLAVFTCALYVRPRMLYVVGIIGLLQVAMAVTLFFTAVTPS